MHYNIIRYAWADRCLGPHTFANGMDPTESKIIPSNVKRPFESVQHCTLQHNLHFSHTKPMYAKTSSQNSVLINGIPKYV